MISAKTSVHLHLLDVIPAVVVAEVTDGLKARGLDPELHDGSFDPEADPVPALRFLEGLGPQQTRPHVYLTSRSLSGAGARPVMGHANRDRDAAIISLPQRPGESRFDARVADRVLKLVVHELGRLAGRAHCDDLRCVMSHADTPSELDAQAASLCAICSDDHR